MDRYNKFVVGKQQMRPAIVRVNVAEWNASAARRASHLYIGADRKQRRRQIAREGRMTAPTLRRDMANIAVSFQAERVGAAPPFALIVENATRVEAEISTDRSHGAVTGTGDRRSGLRDRSVG